MYTLAVMNTSLTGCKVPQEQGNHPGIGKLANYSVLMMLWLLERIYNLSLTKPV